MFALRARRGRVEVAFTDRHRADGGPLNLSLVRDGSVVTGPAPGPSMSDVTESLPREPLGMTQVHGGAVVVVDQAPEPGTWPQPEVDGIVTTLTGLPLLVRAADCMPLLLADPERGVIGAAHCGRPGLLAEIVPHTVGALRDLGAVEIHAWLGPHVCGRCYEVPVEMQEEVAAVLPQTRATTSWGTPSLDIGAGVRAQLDALGVSHEIVDRCTREDDDLWSHRREGPAAGRLGGLVLLHGDPA